MKTKRSQTSQAQPGPARPTQTTKLQVSPNRMQKWSKTVHFGHFSSQLPRGPFAKRFGRSWLTPPKKQTKKRRKKQKKQRKKKKRKTKKKEKNKNKKQHWKNAHSTKTVKMFRPNQNPYLEMSFSENPRWIWKGLSRSAARRPQCCVTLCVCFLYSPLWLAKWEPL